ncbi:hypothetical protein HDV00_009289 [Rhizophlyctis rosea]|nr:hypothetical protein HDV00_009289 [Rhizophlyctis rosea]
MTSAAGSDAYPHGPTYIPAGANGQLPGHNPSVASAIAGGVVGSIALIAIAAFMILVIHGRAERRRRAGDGTGRLAEEFRPRDRRKWKKMADDEQDAGENGVIGLQILGVETVTADAIKSGPQTQQPGPFRMDPCN